MIGAASEAIIKGRLEGVEPIRRVFFACACAERLFPLYGWATAANAPERQAIVRQALDLAWLAGSPQVTSDEILRETRDH